MDEIESAVRELQSAFNNHDRDGVAARVTENHVSILSYARFGGRADLLDAMGRYAFGSYAMSPLTTTPLAPGVALVSFRGALDGTYAGKPVPRDVLVGQVWIRDGGRWREAFYQETPLGPS